MSKLRSLSTSFWSDPYIEDLTPSEKLLFIYLITNDKTNMLGIYEASIKKMSFDTGIDKVTVKKALEGFEKIGKVKYLNNYVVLVNFLKHQNFNTNMKKSAIDVYNNLPKELKDKDLIISKDNPSKGFESLCNHFGMVRKVEVEVEDEYEVEDEIETKDEFENILLEKETKELLKIWLDYRKEIKKPIKSEKTLRSLAEKIQSEGYQKSKLIINNSIQNGWQGLFWDKVTFDNQKSKFENGQDVFLQLMLNDPECQNDPAVIEYRKNNNLGTLKLEQ